MALNLGKRYGIPTVALRYSIVQGPRQSVYNAYSGACRIFCLHYLLGSAPTLYEDGAGDPRLREHPRRGRRQRPGPRRTTGPPGHASSTSAAARRTPPRSSPTSSRVTTAPTWHGHITGEYRFGDTRHIFSDIDALEQLGWAPTRTPADSVAEYADWLEGCPAWTRSWPRRTPGCGRSAWCGRPGHEGVPPGRRARDAGCGRSPTPLPKCMRGRRRPADARHLARRARRRRCRRGAGQHSITWPDVVAEHVAARSGPPGRAPSARAGAPRQRGHAARQPRLGGRRGVVPRVSMPTTSPTSTSAALDRDAPERGRSPHSPSSGRPDRRRAGSSRSRTA